jgi:hypothetical protein
MTALAIATAATIAAASGVAFAESAETIKLSARMDARQVVPQKPKGNVARATGTFTGTLGGSGAARKLSWKITYQNLDHPSIVIADIHYGKRGKFWPRHRSALRPVQNRPARDHQGQGIVGARHQAGELVRDADHRQESQRRDPRPDPRGLSRRKRYGERPVAGPLVRDAQSGPAAATPNSDAHSDRCRRRETPSVG